MFDIKRRSINLLLLVLVGILFSWASSSAYSQAVFLKFDRKMPTEISELLENNDQYGRIIKYRERLSFARFEHVIFVRIEDASTCDILKFCDGLLVNLKLKPLRPQAICLADKLMASDALEMFHGRPAVVVESYSSTNSPDESVEVSQVLITERLTYVSDASTVCGQGKFKE